jgi:hypothetical protein
MSEKLMSVLDFPQEIEKNKFVLLENKGTENENILGAYDTEIEALRIYKNVSHDRKIIIPANVIIANVHGVKMICGYEEI